MIKILTNNLIRTGVIKNSTSASRVEEINGENILDFKAILDSKLSALIDELSIFELGDDYFDIAFFKKDANADDTYTIEVQSDHISYRLNKEEYNVEFFTEMGTPTDILGKILLGTEFTVGVVEYAEIITYSAQEAKSRRQLLMEFVAYLGGEVYFNKFEISIRIHRGNLIPKPMIKGKNVRIMNKTVNKREKDKNGNVFVSYTCDPVYLPIDNYNLGDAVLLIQNDLNIREQLRVVSLTYDPYDISKVTFQFANYINGLASGLYRIETTTVQKDKIYNGTRIGPVYGFENIRSDKKARSYFNATGAAWQIGDGSGVNWVDKLYIAIDPETSLAELMFNGKMTVEVIEALKAEIDVTVTNTLVTQTLYAEKGVIAELTVDQLDTSDKVQNFLNASAADVNYIKINDQFVQFVTASTNGLSTVQVVNRNGQLMYWVDNTFKGTTTNITNFPVMTYVYTEHVKMQIAFEFDGINEVPRMVLGAGTGIGNHGKGYIWKDHTGLMIRYLSGVNGAERNVHLGDDGIRISPIISAPVTEAGLRRITLSTTTPSGGVDGDVWMRYT